MADEAFRITTVKTDNLCAQLDCTAEIDDLDGALADSGYVRLDHGLVPDYHVSIMEMDPPAGRDPGHRGPAIALATNLFHIIHANGDPAPERLREAVRATLEAITTDSVGERIITALAAYSAKKDPGKKPLPIDGPYGISYQAVAAIAYETARHGNVITDVAIERAQSIGNDTQEWITSLLSNMRVEEPVIQVRRHDAADYEQYGIEPPLAELISWIKANPNIDSEDFIRYAKAAGVDAYQAATQIASALGAINLLEHKSHDIENGGPASSM